MGKPYENHGKMRIYPLVNSPKKRTGKIHHANGKINEISTGPCSIAMLVITNRGNGTDFTKPYLLDPTASGSWPSRLAICLPRIPRIVTGKWGYPNVWYVM